MSGIERLREFAKERRLRLHHCLETIRSVPETLVLKGNLSVDGIRVKMSASTSYFVVETRLVTELLFSVGAPSGMGLGVRKVDLPGSAGFDVYVSDLAYENVTAWFAKSTHVRLLQVLKLGQGDAIHVFKNGLIATWNADRELNDDLVSQVLELHRAIAVVTAANVSLDVSVLPPDLRDVTVRFQRVLESDDELRQDIREHLKPSERAELLRMVVPLLPRLNRYLDSIDAVSRPEPDAVTKLRILGELVSEIMTERA